MNQNLLNEGVLRLNTLNLTEEIIDNFKNNKIMISKYGTTVELDNEARKVIEEFEKKFNVKVYHLIYNEVGYCILYISNFEGNWNYERFDKRDRDAGYIEAYCYNSMYPLYSEFNSITIELNKYSIIRVG